MEGGLVTSYEKFVFDLDRCGSLSRMMGGLHIDDNGLGAEAFRDARRGTNFLGVTHTLTNFETANYHSTLADDTSFEQWTEDGALDTAQRANKVWKEMLSSYEPPTVDTNADDALRDFMNMRKNAQEDRWY